MAGNTFGRIFTVTSFGGWTRHRVWSMDAHPDSRCQQKIFRKTSIGGSRAHHVT